MEDDVVVVVGVWGRGALARSGLITLLEKQGWQADDLGAEPLDNAPLGGEAADSDPLKTHLAVLTAALVIVDTPMSVTHAGRLIRELGCPAIALTHQDNADLATAAFHAGARSVIPLETDPNDLIDAIALTRNGLSVITPQAGQFWAAHVTPTGVLSRAETEWLTHLATGATIAQIADTSHHSERTLYRLLAQCYKRIGVSNRKDAIEFARSNGIIPPTTTEDGRSGAAASGAGRVRR